MKEFLTVIAFLISSTTIFAYNTVGSMVNSQNFYQENLTKLTWAATAEEYQFVPGGNGAFHIRIEFNSVNFTGPNGWASVGAMIQNVSHDFTPGILGTQFWGSPTISNVPGMGLYLTHLRTDIPNNQQGVELLANPNVYPRFAHVFEDVDALGVSAKNVYTRDIISQPSPSNPHWITWTVEKVATVTNPVGDFSRDLNGDWVNLVGEFCVWKFSIELDGVSYDVANYYLPSDNAAYLRPDNPLTLHQEYFGSVGMELNNLPTSVKYYNIKATNDNQEEFCINDWRIVWKIDDEAGNLDQRYGWGVIGDSLLSSCGHADDVNLLREIDDIFSGGGTSCQIANPCGNPDSLALMALYHSTNGANWTNNTGWGASCDLSTWHGVVTDPQTGRVFGLDLFNNGLSGTIPAEIGNLSELFFLKLFENNLTGSIPSSIGQLTKLHHFDVGDNQLSGDVPATLWDCMNMFFLSLGGNQFTGQIPSDIQNMPYLGYLNLSRNDFSGAIPIEIANLNELNVLELQENNFTGDLPDIFGNLHFLDNLRVHDNNLTGALPLSLGNIARLQVVLMQNNDFSGCFPYNYANFCTNSQNYPNTQFDFSGNSQLPNGGSFVDFCNNGTGICPTDLTCDWVQLFIKTEAQPLNLGFNFSNNNQEPIISGGAYSFDNNTNLSFYYFFHIPDDNFIFSISDYEGTSVDSFALVDFVGATSDVVSVLIDNPSFTNDYQSPSLRSCPLVCHPDYDALKALYAATDGGNWMDNTNWDTTLVTSCNPCADNWYGVGCDENGRVNSLSLFQNNLSGSLPTQLVNLTELDSVDLSGNQLIGTIPNNLGGLANLFYLNLDNNNLLGNIPVELGDLSSLGHLILSNNNLDGTIPNSLDNLNQLTGLNLSNNSLTGALPEGLGNLPLEYLILNDNDFSGCLPASLSNLCAKAVDLTNNTNLEEEDFSAFCNTNSGLCIPCIPSVDSLALMTIYHALDGPNWLDNTGWGTDCNVENWYGVSTNMGRVSSLNLENNGLNGNLPTEIGDLSYLEFLILNDNAITGSIPSTIGQLLGLQRFEINNNQVSGNIPTELWNCNFMSYLSLANNQLDGQIPVAISNTSYITYLNLSQNNFSGTIPSEIGNLSFLNTLELQENNFSGDFPDNFVSLRFLEHFKVYDNNLTGPLPTFLGNSILLKTVQMQQNDFSGCFPYNYVNLCNNSQTYPNTLFDFSDNPQLPNGGDFTDFCNNNAGVCNTDLSCEWVQLFIKTGVEPLHLFFHFVALENGGNQNTVISNELYFTENNPDTSLKYIFHIPEGDYDFFIADGAGNGVDSFALVELTNVIGNESDLIINPPFNSNYQSDPFNINCTVPCSADFEPLKALYAATDGGNWTNNTNWDTTNVTSCDPCADNWFGVQCENGRVINIALENNNLVGSIPTQIGELSELKVLNLSRNQLTNSLPVELGNLSNLTILDVQVNQMTGTVPVELSNLTNLTILNLGFNDLSGTIPAELGLLVNLVELQISSEQISGTIPVEIGNLVELTHLSLGRDLSGEIPSVIGNLSKLKFLDLGLNNLTGSIPVEIGNLMDIEQISFVANQLTGTIPEELGSLPKLWNIDLGINQLSGNIPKELSNLNNLSGLYLNDNQLTGTIPKELGSLEALSLLYLNNNQLSGCIPTELSNLCDNEFLIAQIDNNPNLAEQDFSAFCATGSGTCTVQWVDLFTNVDTVWANGAAGPIQILNEDVIPLMAATNCEFAGLPSFAVGTAHGQGHVIGIGHEKGIDDTGIDFFDNLTFFKNTIEFLNNGQSKRVGINNGWTYDGNMTTIITALEAEGYTFTTLSIPLTSSQLDTMDVLLMGNDWRNEGMVPQTEVDVVESFVQSGGGALIMGLGWSWPNDLADYPMNRFASPFGFSFATNYFLEPVNIFNTLPYFVNMYPNIDLEAICPPFVCPSNNDSLALMALYHSTNGANWTNNTGWGASCDLSTWHGVSTNEYGNVVALNLENNNLVGAIPNQIDQLTDLQILNMEENQLTGDLSPILFLTQLFEIHLDNNQLSGFIPAAIGNFSNLRILRLANNNLSGVLPDEMGNLTQMYWIALSDNDFSGTFPDIFEHWNQIHDIRVNGNNFEGDLPVSLGFKTSLRVAEFHDNNFSGCFPFNYKNLCANKDNIFEAGFSFYDNPLLPNNGDFDQFCIDESGMCNETIGCEWVEVVFNTGPNPLNFSYGFEPSTDGLPAPGGSYFFDTNSPNTEFTYYHELSEDFYRFHINNHFGNGLGFFEVRHIESQTVLVENTTFSYSHSSEFFPICDVPIPEGSLIVTNLDDDGLGSLRGAIEYANELPGKDTIQVEVAGKIVPTCPAGSISEGNCLSFFTITDEVVIQGNGITIAPETKGRLLTNYQSSLKLENLTLEDVDYDFNGGVLFNFEGYTELERVLIANNQSAGMGNIRNKDGALFIRNSTFSNNQAGEGGAIYNEGQSTILNSTLTDNSANNGGSIFQNYGNLTLSSSIIANSMASSPEDLRVVGGGVNTTSANLVESCNGNCPTFAVTADPLLGPLRDNGGYTLTHELLAGSPAINTTGVPSAPPADQRGFVGITERDMGAYESDGQQTECLENKYIGYDIMDGTEIYTANNSVAGDEEIMSGSSVMFMAGEEIILRPGFHVKAGATFEAKIEECSITQPLVRSVSDSPIEEEEHFQQNTIESMTSWSSKIKVYPNPTERLLNVDLPVNQQLSIRLIDMTGRLLQEQRNVNGSTNINLDNLTDGIYFLHIHNTLLGESSYQKVIKGK